MKKILYLFFIISVSLFSAEIGPWSNYVEVTSDVTVNAGDWLTVDAGTIVRVGPNVSITVNGELKVNGTDSDPVMFAALDRWETPWYGITIENSAGNSIISHAIFKDIQSPAAGGKGSLSIINSTATVNNCSFKYNFGDKGGGIMIDAGTVSVSGCEIRDNEARFGGGIHIQNGNDNPSTVNIDKCRIYRNQVWSNNGGGEGGGIYFEDIDGSLGIMDLNITNCAVFDNFAEYSGAGVAFNNKGRIDLELSKTEIFTNEVDLWGGGLYGAGIYGVYLSAVPGNIQPQRIENLLIYKNRGLQSGGVHLNMGQTQNPLDLNFRNVTIADNQTQGVKTGAAGLQIDSQGNYPKINSTIIWNNLTDGMPNSFFINDSYGSPSPDQVFFYCDVQGLQEGGITNINSLPIFVRPPQITEYEELDENRYDYHLSLLSPCVNTGDVAFTDPDGSRLNMGAFGGTVEATPGTYESVIATGTTNLNIIDNSVTVLDFQRKAGTFNFDDITLGEGSQLYLKQSENALINVKNIYSPDVPAGKFNGGYCKIQQLQESTTTDNLVQNLTVSETAQLINADMSDIILTVAKSSLTDPNIIIKNTKLYTTVKDTTNAAVNVIDAGTVYIQDSRFDDYATGIVVKTTANKKGPKASGRISNNSVTFDPDVASKANSQKRVGVSVENSNIDVEDNEITGGDEGIMMSKSSGRITNNSVTFEADVASKKGLYEKIGINIINGTEATEVYNNFLYSYDGVNDAVSGISVDSSRAKILYNVIYSENEWSGTKERNGVVLNNVLDSTYIYNNTFFGNYKTLVNTPSSAKVDFINNIYWAYGTPYQTATDTTNIRFYNNCTIDTLDANVTGGNNINDDPEMYSMTPDPDDLCLTSSSPCINAGMIISGIHIGGKNDSIIYYGTAPDMGANEFFEGSLDSPSSFTCSTTDSTFTMDWTDVANANTYKIYSAEDPYGSYTHITTVTSSDYTATISSAKKFYYVIASSSMSKGSFEQDTEVPYSQIRKIRNIQKRPRKISIKKKRNSR